MLVAFPFPRKGSARKNITSGWDPVRPEALEGRTGYFQSRDSSYSNYGFNVQGLSVIFAVIANEAKQSRLVLMRLLRAAALAMTIKRPCFNVTEAWSTHKVFQ